VTDSPVSAIPYFLNGDTTGNIHMIILVTVFLGPGLVTLSRDVTGAFISNLMIHVFLALKMPGNYLKERT
jgi:hypothetical protein